MVIVYKSAADFVEAAQIFALHNVLYQYQESLGAKHSHRQYVAFFDKLGNLHRGEYIETVLVDPERVTLVDKCIYYSVVGGDPVTLETYTTTPDSDLQKHKEKVLGMRNNMLSWAECLDCLKGYTTLDVENIKA